MNVEVCYALPDGATRIALTVEAGTTVGAAIAQSGIVALLALDRGALDCAVFGRRATDATVLADGDRVELLRPLTIDPKEARHRRVAIRRARAGR